MQRLSHDLKNSFKKHDPWLFIALGVLLVDIIRNNTIDRPNFMSKWNTVSSLWCRDIIFYYVNQHKRNCTLLYSELVWGWWFDHGRMGPWAHSIHFWRPFNVILICTRFLKFFLYGTFTENETGCISNNWKWSKPIYWYFHFTMIANMKHL